MYVYFMYCECTISIVYNEPRVYVRFTFPHIAIVLME